MTFKPDYQSAEDARAGWRSAPRSAGVWLTVLSSLASAGALAKAFLVSGGILQDEKPTVVIMSAVAWVLSVASIRASAKRRELGGLFAGALAVLMLIGAAMLLVRAWR